LKVGSVKADIVYLTDHWHKTLFKRIIVY